MKTKHKLILLAVSLSSLVWIVVLVDLLALRSPQQTASVDFIESETFEFDSIRLHDRVAPWRLPPLSGQPDLRPDPFTP